MQLNTPHPFYQFFHCYGLGDPNTDREKNFILNEISLTGIIYLTVALRGSS